MIDSANRTLSSYIVPGAVPVNHLLRAASWARDKLRPFSGKTARFTCSPFSLALTVLASGEVQDAANDIEPATEFMLTPSLALRAFAGDDKAWHEIKISGDAGFSSAIAYVAQHLRWDIEEDLSRIFGDIAAHRIAESGRNLQKWGKETIDNFTRNLVVYWTEEQPLIASRDDIDHFKNEVTRLRHDAEQLEKRIAQLIARHNKKPL